MRFPSPPVSISPTARSLALFALALVVFALGGACEDKHVGRPCMLGTAPMGGSSGSIATVSSPALECPSHICLLPGAEKDPRSAAQITAMTSGTGPLCTAHCESSEDCEDGEQGNATNADDKRCRNGFACTWPTTVGNFACQRLCVCRDFFQEPPGGVRKPTVCN